MTVRTKPVRIFESDDAALSVLAGVLRRGRSEVLHAAIAEYLANHREELAGLFAATQRAVAAGDVDALARASAAALEHEIDSLVAGLPT
jgi:predicted transcriptional regulator